MKKLWIDDIRIPPDGWDWAKTSKEALEMIRTKEYVEVSFDHDLGGDDDAYIVALEIENGAKFSYWPAPIKWHIHSMNPVGRARLKASLEQSDKYWEEEKIYQETGSRTKRK